MTASTPPISASTCVGRLSGISSASATSPSTPNSASASAGETGRLASGRSAVRRTCGSNSRSAKSLITQPAERITKVPMHEQHEDPLVRVAVGRDPQRPQRRPQQQPDADRPVEPHQPRVLTQPAAPARRAPARRPCRCRLRCSSREIAWLRPCGSVRPRRPSGATRRAMLDCAPSSINAAALWTPGSRSASRTRSATLQLHQARSGACRAVRRGRAARGPAGRPRSRRWSRASRRAARARAATAARW